MKDIKNVYTNDAEMSKTQYTYSQTYQYNKISKLNFI